MYTAVYTAVLNLVHMYVYRIYTFVYLEHRGAAGVRVDLGFGRIVVSATEAPNMLVNLVWSG